MKENVQKLLAILLGLILGSVFVNALQIASLQYGYRIVLALIAWSALAFIIYLLRDQITLIPTWIFLAAASLVYLGTRVGWMYFVRTPAYSDFVVYHGIAAILARGLDLSTHTHWSNLILGLGYPWLLSGWYALLGIDVLYAQILNILLELVALFFLYLLGNQKSRTTARILTLLFVAWPSGSTYIGLPASEHLALPLVCMAVYLFLRYSKSEKTSPFMFMLVGGILTLAFVTRGTLIVVLLSILLVLFLDGPLGKQKVFRTGIILVSFLALLVTYDLGMQSAYHIDPLNQGRLNILVGTNIAANGMWNLEDALQYGSFDNVAEANQYALTEAIRRVRADPVGYATLSVRKIFTTWATDDYGVFFSVEGIPDFPQNPFQRRLKTIAEILSHSFHILILGLSAFACYHFIRTQPARQDTILTIVLLLAGTALHMIFETQPRYHYWMEPLLMYLAASYLSDVIFSPKAHLSENASLS